MQRQPLDGETSRSLERLFRLLEAGGEFVVDPQAKKRILVFNVFMATAASLCAVYSFVLVFFSLTMTAVTVIAALICAAALLLSMRGRFTEGRIVYLSAMTVMLAVYACLIGDSSPMTMVFPVALLPFAVMSKDERALMTYGLTLPLAAWVTMECVGYDILGPPVVTASITGVLHVLIPPTASVLVLMLLWAFSRSRERLLQDTQRARRLSAAVLDTIADGVLVANADGTIFRANPAIEALTASPSGGIVGRTLDSVIASPLRGEPREATAAARPVRREGTLEGAVPVELQSSHTEAKGGEIEIVVVRDMRAQKATERRLRELTARLRRASRQGGMAHAANGVLHGIGNLLTTLSVSSRLTVEALAGSKTDSLGRVVELLAGEGSDSPKEGKALRLLELVSDEVRVEHELLYAEARRASAGIDHICEIIGQKTQRIERAQGVEPCRIDEVVEDAVDLVRASLDAEGVEIRMPAPGSGSLVQVDRILITEALVNFLKNAKEAMRDTPKDSRVIEIGVERGDAELSIAVRDRGVGLTEAQREKLFANGYTTKADGHGVGLHESARAVRAQGGDLSARSEGPGRGAEFTIRIPLART